MAPQTSEACSGLVFLLFLFMIVHEGPELSDSACIAFVPPHTTATTQPYQYQSLHAMYASILLLATMLLG
jgi:hypothetical protein